MAGALLAAAGPAGAASTVSVDATFGDLDYVGDAGVNVVTFTDEAAPTAGDTRVRVAETGVVANAGCVQNGPNAAYCDISDIDGVDARLQGGNDVATNNGTRVRYSLSGEGGDDELTGADAEIGAFFDSVFDTLDGGAGRDTLTGRAGDDSLDGGPDDGDLVDGGEGEDQFTLYEGSGVGDVLRGGPGFDKLFAFWFGPDPAPGVVVDLAAGTASVAGMSSAVLEAIEDADGDEGNDVLLGTAGANAISGDEGNDVIDGRAGPDRLEGDEGDDQLEGRDGFFDLLAGGPGTDSCNADQLDTRETCEGGVLAQVAPFGTPAPPDRTAPACTVAGVKSRVPARRIRRRGVRMTVECDESGRVVARLLARVRRVGRRPAASAVGDLELAARGREVTQAQSAQLRLRVPARLRRVVRRGARLRLQLTAADTAGNERITTRRLRLR